MVYLVKFFLWMLYLLPAGMPYRLSEKGAGLLMRLSPVKRHTTERNLERCYPEMDAAERGRLARASFQHYLCSILEAGHNWYWSRDKLESHCDGVTNLELFLDAKASGKGLLVLAPHFGAWEYLGIYLQAIGDVAILYKPPSNPGLEKALHRAAQQRGRYADTCNHYRAVATVLSSPGRQSRGRPSRSATARGKRQVHTLFRKPGPYF